MLTMDIFKIGAAISKFRNNPDSFKQIMRDAFDLTMDKFYKDADQNKKDEFKKFANHYLDETAEKFKELIS